MKAFGFVIGCGVIIGGALSALDAPFWVVLSVVAVATPVVCLGAAYVSQERETER